MYTVSVIMPVYNNENSLEASIASLLNQSMFDIELILINDGSTDGSAQICNRYQSLEPLIVEVIHQPRSGFGAARNKGLSIATGKYVYFANATDVYEKRMLETNVRLAEEKEADLVVFGFSVQNKLATTELTEYLPNLPFLPNKKRFRNHFRNFSHFYPYMLSNKLYKRNHILKHRFKLFNLNEENEAYFNLALYKDIETVAFNRHAFYIRPSEFFNEEISFSQKNFDTQIDIANYLEVVIKGWGLENEFEDVILQAFFNAVYSEIMLICKEDSNLSLEKKEIRVSYILNDERIKPYFKRFGAIKEKSPLKRALLPILQNGNGKTAIQVITHVNGTKEKTSKVLGLLRNLLNK